MVHVVLMLNAVLLIGQEDLQLSEFSAVLYHVHKLRIVVLHVALLEDDWVDVGLPKEALVFNL
jgi:hypothetical protein